MLESVRARLTLWYAGVFALLLTGTAAAGYFFLSGIIRSQIDSYLEETSAAIASALRIEHEAGKGDSAAAHAVSRTFRYREIGMALYDARSGRQLAASAAAAHPGAPPDSLAPFPAELDVLARGVLDEPIFVTFRSARAPERAYLSRVGVGGHPVVLAVTYSFRAGDHVLREVRYIFVIVIPLGLALAALGGYLLARKSLQPVVDMGETAERIGATTLHERLPVANDRDELGRLATVLNHLLGRLDRSFQQQRQFMADASHELRTPVAVIAGEAELSLSRADRSMQEYRDALRVIYGESQRMTRIVDDLFLLARVDAGEQPLVVGDLYVDELLMECVRSVRALASGRDIEVQLAPLNEELPYRGDANLLRRLFINLLDNAIKYSRRGGTVWVTAEHRPQEYRIAIRDSGAGIPLDAQPRIFERFFQVMESRAPGDGSTGAGAGLGLAIARWIAQAHGGGLGLVHSGADGSVFAVSLPKRTED